ncbi:MAG: hypothetical protein U0183_08080 [Polyangiaceae bacterium]
MSRSPHFLAAFLVALALPLSSPKLALAAGLSADPRVPTAPLEQVVVTSARGEAVVSVWPKRAGKVYVLPKPKGVVPGSLQVLASGGMTRLDRETAMAHLHATIPKPTGMACAHGPGPSAVLAFPERPLSAREWANQRDERNPPVTTCGIAIYEDLACDTRRPLPLAFVESTDATLDADVRSRGGELPTAFAPEKGASYWVFQNLGGAMIRYRTSGLAELPLVTEAKGGSHEALLIALMRETMELDGRTFHTAMLPAELDGLRAVGAFVLPPKLPLAEAEAAVVESRYGAGSRAVVVRVAQLFRPQLTFDACSAAGLEWFGRSFEGVAVRARIRGLDTLSLRERRVRPVDDGVFVTIRDPPGVSALLDEKVCLEYEDREGARAATTRPPGAPPVVLQALTFRPNGMATMRAE